MAHTPHPLSFAVKGMYEAFPYPHYPLFLSLKWQDGYLGSSLFARRLLGAPLKTSSEVLVIGAGEVLPYILRKMEPQRHHLTCIDLSEKSLKRARVRLLWEVKKTSYKAICVDQYLKVGCQLFDHMDCYGVLMCLANPSKTLDLMARRLSPSGTIRLMVYNKQARRWIYQIQKAFSLMGLDIYHIEDLEAAQRLLAMMANASTALSQKFALMGPYTFKVKARLVDTFFHKREAQTSIKEWFDAFDRAHLRPYALYDRYDELDDLCNPLAVMPSREQLIERAEDLRFENNLEVYLCHKETAADKKEQKKVFHRGQFLRMLRRSPPTSWFQSEETKSISYLLRQKIYWHHCSYTAGGEHKVDRIIDKIGDKAAMRLFRRGAFFDGQVESKEMKRWLRKPLVEKMAPRVWGDGVNFHLDEKIRKEVTGVLAGRKRFSEKTLFQVLERLNRSQL